MSEQHKAEVRRWFEEVWNNRRGDAIAEMLAPEARIHGPEALFDPASFRSLHEKYLSVFPDIRFEMEDMVAEGDKVAFRWTVSGTHTGDGLGVPPTGKEVRFAGMGIVRFENGRIVEGWDSYDRMGMMQQLGIV
jgi:steroid delta-isomerase-like uncharacterized protein